MSETKRGEERLVASLLATPRSGVRTGAERIPVSGHLHGLHTLSSTTILWYAEFIVYPCTAVAIVIPRTCITPSFSYGLCFRA